MAPLTLEDIMEFMKKDKEERTQWRENDKEKIKNMISSGVKDKVEKIFKPIQERQDGVERTQEDMKGQFKQMVDEVKQLKSNLHNPNLSFRKAAPS